MDDSNYRRAQDKWGREKPDNIDLIAYSNVLLFIGIIAGLLVFSFWQILVILTLMAAALFYVKTIIGEHENDN